MVSHLKRSSAPEWFLKEDHSPVSHKQVFLNWGKIKHSDQIDRFGVLIPTSGESLAKYHVFPVHRQWLVIGVFNRGTCEHLTIQISTCYYRHAIFNRSNMKALGFCKYKWIRQQEYTVEKLDKREALAGRRQVVLVDQIFIFYQTQVSLLRVTPIPFADLTDVTGWWRYRVFFSLGLSLKCLSTKKLI